MKMPKYQLPESIESNSIYKKSTNLKADNTIFLINYILIHNKITCHNYKRIHRLKSLLRLLQ